MKQAVIYSCHLEKRENEPDTSDNIDGTKNLDGILLENVYIGIKKSPQALIDWLIDKVILYDDKIEIYYLYTAKTDPDDCRGFVIRWWIFCFETRHYSKNELNKRVQLIPTCVC